MRCFGVPWAKLNWPFRPFLFLFIRKSPSVFTSGDERLIIWSDKFIAPQLFKLIPEKLKAYFENDRFTALTGVEIVGADKGFCKQCFLFQQA